MARPFLRLLLGLLPFLVILATLGAFLLRRDPMVFAWGGLAAALYVLGFVLLTRAMRRGAAPGRAPASRPRRRPRARR